jgi:hypothetical protein
MFAQGTIIYSLDVRGLAGWFAYTSIPAICDSLPNDRDPPDQSRVLCRVIFPFAFEADESELAYIVGRC